jgi:hypothetical protein
MVVVVAMNSLSLVQMKLVCNASEALRRIAEATTREGLPFLSPIDPGKKPFVSRIDGARFRIWKWPSRARGRNQLVPILHGQITDEEGGSVLTGSFRLHPFSRMLPWFIGAVTLALSALIWLNDSDLRARTFAILLLVACITSALFAFRKQKTQLRDEDQVLKFLRNLLAELVEEVP